MISYFTILLWGVFFLVNTPAPSEWNRKILLGTNDDHYFYLEIKRNHTGTYFFYIDSTFLMTRSLESGKIVNNRLLRITNHRDTTTMSDWVHKDVFNDPLDLNQYLVKNEIRYVFNTMATNSVHLKFDQEGLLMKKKDKEIKLNELSYFFTQSEDFKMDFLPDWTVIEDIYESDRHLFFLVRTGMDSFDSIYTQHIFFITKGDFNQARKKLFKMVEE